MFKNYVTSILLLYKLQNYCIEIYSYHMKGIHLLKTTQKILKAAIITFF